MDIKQYDRGEWLAIRRTHISSTESPALFGMSPYMTPYELAVQKQAVEPVEFDDNERMLWGRRLQNAIAQGIADDYRVMIESLEYAYAVHPDEPRMGSSFDYRIVGVPDDMRGSHQSPTAIGALYERHGPGLLEIKNVDALQYRDWPEHDAPDHIEIQVQHQLEVARCEWCVLGVLVGGNRTEVYTRMRDGAVGGAIVKKVHEFWANLERGVLPPPVLPADADLIIKLHQYAEPSKVFNGQEDVALKALCSEYADATDALKEIGDVQKSLKAKILTHIGDAERALVDGFSVSASMVAPAEVKAYTRNGYRNFRLTRKQERVT
jgi:putative phage-type endonuclease